MSWLHTYCYRYARIFIGIFQGYILHLFNFAYRIDMIIWSVYIEKKFVKYHIHLIAFIFFSFRTYSIGFVILVGVGFDRLCKAFPAIKKILYCLFSVTIISFSIKTITYNRVWKSRETLFRLVNHYYYFHWKKPRM